MDITQLEEQSKIADAELGVAEELSWGIAILAGLLVYLKADAWYLALAAAGVAYWLATFRYRRKSAAAEEAFFKAAKLGKYADLNQ